MKILFLIGILIVFAVSTALSETDERFAAFRVVRETPGEPGRPEIVLPEGYRFVDGDRYHVASRAEFYTFVQGPHRPPGIPVTVRWPGERIHAVIGSNQRLDLKRDPSDPDAVTFRLPVVAASPNADQSTIQVWSHLDPVPGLRWRVEHNDPDRVAGPWTGVAWPATQARSVIHQLVAADMILRDSGLAAQAAAKGHFIALMGFETNNTLHPDNPPHWHIVYYAGNTFRSPAYLPHFWVNAEGRNFYNGMDVTGQGRQRYRAGDPAPMYDFDGNLALTTTIREEGGLDIDPPDGPRYSIVPGTKGDLVHDIEVERAGERWLRVMTHDDVRAGVMIFQVVDLQEPANSRTAIHTYDRLTGRLLETASHPLSRRTAGGDPPVAIVAHRGAMTDRPENTMAAFERAVELGADVVELDVRMSRDGELFLLHDATLDRTTDGEGRAAELTFDELRRLDAGSWFGPAYAGEKIPSLKEALRWGRERTVLLLDLKDTSSAYNEAVAAAVREAGDPARIVIGVRTPDQAHHFRELLPESRQLAFMRRPALIEEFAEAGADILRLWHDRNGWLADDPSLADRVRATGRKLMINGTTGHFEEVEAIMRFQPDWILIDDVARLKHSLERLRAAE